MSNGLKIFIISLVIFLLGGFIVLNTSKAELKGTPIQSTTPQTKTISQKEMDLRLNMRKLWEDHITWTRMYLVSAISDAEDTDNIANRLLKNQEDIGNAMKPYYGNSAGDRLTQLLKTHIATAVDLVSAAKVNDQQAFNSANDRWYQNANEIADFLSSANSNWPREQMRSMMREHLDLTKQEAVDIMGKKFDENIADYDKIHDQILKMADMLSTGIIKQFPNKF